MAIPESDRTSHEFSAFMQAYQDMVFSTAARLLGSDAQAEDIAQEVFIKAYENFSQLQVSVSAGGWLKTVATNLSLNYLSRHRKRWRLFSELRNEADEHEEFESAHWLADAWLDEPMNNLVHQQRQALIEQSLDQLPDNLRVPLVLRHFEDMSYEQIAQQLQVSLAKVKVDIHRARLLLAKRLGQSWNTL